MHWSFYYILRTPFTFSHVARNSLMASQGTTENRKGFTPRKEFTTYTPHIAAAMGG
jgi:hypothetical protein